MDLLNNFDIYPKILVALTGLIAAFIKFKETFSVIKRKEEIKLDLEILELLKKNEGLNKFDLEKRIENRLSQSLNKTNEGLTNFIIGLAVFIGFGLWSIDIFQSYNYFNGWILLTAFCSLLGFTMLFDSNKADKSKDVFFKIGFYDKSNFRFGFVVTILAGIITPIMIFKMDGFSFWQFLSGLFFIIGLKSIYSNIRKIE